MNGLRVAITVALSDAAGGLWSNGIKQNALFLMDALRRCPNVAEVWLANTGEIGEPKVSWDDGRWPIAPLTDILESVDVLIELGSQISADQTQVLKQRNAKLVSHCSGSEYVHAMESMAFGRNSYDGGLFINRGFDQIWMIPQVAQTSRAYFETFRRVPAKVIPFVWDPSILEEHSRSAPYGGVCQPQRDAAPWRLAVMEPNINVVKFCLYPILIAEEAYRARPYQIELMVTNAEHLAQGSIAFIRHMNELDIVRAGKAVFVGRYSTPDVLGQMADAVVSHQWGNPLNYLYLEVCWQGYPLIHNASLCRDLGYYYSENDVPQGARQLLNALEHHDGQLEQYRARQRAAIERFRPRNPAVTRAYTELLDSLFSVA